MDILVEKNLAAYEKCGEIMTSFAMDKRLYALKCLFCEEHFSALYDFVEHTEEAHFSTKKEKDVSENDEQVNSFNVEPKEEVFDIDLNEVQSQICTDPLTSDKKKDGIEVFPNDCVVKQESDDEYMDADYDSEDNSEASDDCETDDDNDRKPNKNFLNVAIDANKDVITALIENLEKLPILWEKHNTPPQARKKREEALKNLTKDINKKFGKRMKWPGTEESIKKLRKCFRNELKKEKIAESKGEVFNPSWYFAKLEFLRRTIKIKERKPKNVDKSAETEIPFKDEQQIQFINIYENFPCLWNTEDVGFKSKNQRDNALKKMQTMIEEKIKIKLTENELQRKIQRLRTACTKEKHEIFNCERLGTVHKPVYKYSANIAFLIDHVCPFKCPFCSKTFKGREIFRVHKSQHDGSSPFTCSICKKNFSSPGNLAIHLRRHNRDYLFECKPCSRKFATTDEYNIHMRQHTGEKPYFCEICGKSFATCSLFGRHKRRHEKRPSHLCTICNRGFYEQIRYKEHMNIHNNVRDRVCEVCGKGFTHLKYLKQHVLIHTGRRDYVCTICGKDFAQSAGLYWHMKTHGAKVSDKAQNDEKTKRKDIPKQPNSDK